jgi:tRNA G18 (ribose-2'-O)-methylase SpoU
VGAISKTALGAETKIPWESYEDIETLIAMLKQKQIQVIAIEQSDRSVDYKIFQASGAIACIAGNEVGGVPESVLKLCDAIIEIPMKGTKESLNVSVAAGVALFRILGV